MAQFDEMIATMKAADFGEKKQFLEYFAQLTERSGRKLAQEDRNALLNYCYEEAEHMLRAIPDAANYKEKDLIFQCEDCLMGIVMHLEGKAENLPPEAVLKLKALAELVDKERYLETAVDSIFQQQVVTETDINRVLYWARQSMDEYRKSRLFLGLGHYHRELSRLDGSAKRAMSAYMAEELNRLMALDGEDIWNSLELLADVSKFFVDETILDGLEKLLEAGRNHINFYAVETLLSKGRRVPQSVIEALAKDLEYASLACQMLHATGNASLFPAEYATEEYLAKSDLVRWLTYPTELGKVPDEIVYIGKIRQLFKKEVFHVFKFRSDSDTLGDELKNKWLVGWSSNEGGTFSNFDEFAPFEMETTEKTLKLIKRNLIGR